MKLYNSEKNILNDTQRGIALLLPHLKSIAGTRGYVDRNFTDSYIPIISGSGAGHEPSDWGFVGTGILTASVTGELFIPPTAEEIVKVARKVTNKKRAFFIIKNFPADVANFTNAIEFLKTDDWEIESCIVNDDISVDTNSLKQYRRGLAGTILLEKILGALTKQNASLTELKMASTNILLELKTIGIAFNDSILSPKKHGPLALGQDDIYYGIGIHGEPGYRKEHWKTSELTAREIINKMRINFNWHKNEQFALLVNNLGKITKMEEMIFTADIIELLELEGIKISFCKVGTFMSSHDMSGVSVTLLRLNQHWKDLLEAPASTYSWTNNI